MYSKFYFRPQRGEQISTVITPDGEDGASICGAVVDGKGRPMADALVLLFRSVEDGVPEPLARFRTDSDGHFIFGPLTAGELYLIKVFKNDVRLRVLEVRAEQES